MSDRPVLEPTASHPITVEPTGKRVTVRVNGELVADTDEDAMRIAKPAWEKLKDWKLAYPL